MRNKKLGINSFEDLKKTKNRLKRDIKEQEKTFKNNPLFKISSSLFGGSSFESSLKTSVDSISLDSFKTLGLNLLSTILMANKKTRKFFIAFVIAKEMIPFTLQKINEIVKK
jgi:hypothetical protein